MLKKIRALLAGRGQKNLAETPTRPTVHQGPQVVHNPIPERDLDPDAVKILQRLTRFDHKAYLVGGCVRDLLLDRSPKDFDIATSATPRQVRRVFRNCRIIGRRFRLAHIYFQNGKIIEVATFRASGDAGDDSGTNGDLLIREDNQFGTPESDALRRDFTVNSLFYDLADGTVIDHAQGLEDLRRKLVRTIGDPDIRFPEDPIRILRAVKFAARLGFTIEPGTLNALRKARVEIPKAASPRILEEIGRFGREGAARRSFELLRETEVFQSILPELAEPYRRDGAWRVLFAILDAMDRRRQANYDVGPGEVFAALLIPALMDKLGWSANGTARQPKKLDLRNAVDGRLGPIALRLRVSRRDQETCRQIIGILFRMVPLENVRPSTRRGLLRRVSFPDALWMLEALADVLGGDFAESYQDWKASAPGPSKGDTSRPSGTNEEQDRPRSRRRGRRRGGRGRGKGDAEKTAPPKDAKQDAKPRAQPKPREAAKAPDGRKRPAPEKWDDDYFFAALPHAPKMAANETRGDRYGADRVAEPAADRAAEPAADRAAEPAADRAAEPAAEPAADRAAEQPDDSTLTGDDSPVRRRRRRRRRRGSGRGAAAQASDGDGQDRDGSSSSDE